MDAVAANQAAGTARAGDPFAIAATTWCAMHGLVMLRIVNPHFPWPDLETALDEVLTGLVGLPAQ